MYVCMCACPHVFACMCVCVVCLVRHPVTSLSCLWNFSLLFPLDHSAQAFPSLSSLTYLDTDRSVASSLRSLSSLTFLLSSLLLFFSLSSSLSHPLPPHPLLPPLLLSSLSPPRCLTVQCSSLSPSLNSLNPLIFLSLSSSLITSLSLASFFSQPIFPLSLNTCQ